MRPLRIAQLAAPFETVPPEKYGGTERVISTLTEELVGRGHSVTLFASGDSSTSGRLIPTVETALWHDPDCQEALPHVMVAIDTAYRRCGEFDIIHNHLEWMAFPAARACRGTPTLSTIHSRLDIPDQRAAHRHFAGAPLVSISQAQRSPLPGANWVATVYNGIELPAYTSTAASRGYLAFLGRISPEKGLDTAIEVARRTGLPLKIAARMPLNQPHNADAQRDWCYYREAVEPHLKEPGIEYLGELGTVEKHAFLAGAMGLLFPIRWPEPFGLAMVEALACGTPVISLRRGSAPEVIEDGVTGFVVDDEEGLVRAVSRLSEIDPARCRAVVERRFSAAAMAEGYEQAYYHVLGMVPRVDRLPTWPGNGSVPLRVPALTATTSRLDG